MKKGATGQNQEQKRARDAPCHQPVAARAASRTRRPRWKAAQVLPWKPSPWASSPPPHHQRSSRSSFSSPSPRPWTTSRPWISSPWTPRLHVRESEAGEVKVAFSSLFVATAEAGAHRAPPSPLPHKRTVLLGGRRSVIRGHKHAGAPRALARARSTRRGGVCDAAVRARGQHLVVTQRG